MSELTTDTGAAASEATVLMHMYRDVWASDRDVTTFTKTLAEESNLIEPALSEFVSEHHLHVVGDVDGVQSHHVGLLGRKLADLYLKEKVAAESLRVAQQRLQEENHALFVFSSTLTNKIVTVEAIDEANPPIRRLVGEYDDGWTSRARGRIQPTSRLGLLSLRSTSFWGGLSHLSYLVRPIDDDGNPHVRLTIDGSLY